MMVPASPTTQPTGVGNEPDDDVVEDASTGPSRSVGTKLGTGGRGLLGLFNKGAAEREQMDAVSLSKADHRKLEDLFEKFGKARDKTRKASLAREVCTELMVHATIEEEIFYPAFLEATGDTEIHHEAEIEHEGAKRLIEEIESNGPRDDHFEARVSVLKEMIKHHVKEEEQRGGMFSKAQSSEMDLRALGQQLMERKLELMGDSTGEDAMEGRMPPQSRGRNTGRELRTRSS